jgi:type III restriction enzyme
VTTIDNPILNSPFAEPTRHWVLDGSGIPIGTWAEGRRRSEYVVPVPPPKHQHVGQGVLELDAEYGKPESNDYVNELRAKVGAWRALSPSQQERPVTPVTARLLRHWRNPERERRLFFCQIEAVETAIWLAEVAPRSELDRLRALNADANPELFRIALKLATGAGKTTVMAMLIAWQTLNHARSPGSSRFTDSFLVITPGITIRDRLRVLMPSDPNNTYLLHDLVPPDQRDALHRARVVITNYHAFRPRETLEAPKLTKEMLGGRAGPVKTLESVGVMIRRVCGDLLSRKQIVVLNDEAHHCYRERETARQARLTAEERSEVKRSKEAARLWISGIEALQRVIKRPVAIYDLSATPFFLRGSGYEEGELFPWVVSDFSLIDAIECGIVKVPRVPVQDLPGGTEPIYRHVYKHVRDKLPKAGRGKQAAPLDPDKLPTQLEGALTVLYGHYAKVFAEWQKRGSGTPPVFIVVCNNTATSKLVFDHIAGYQRQEGEASFIVPGRLKLFSNVDDNGAPEQRRFLDQPSTILIDSEQLESGEALLDEFRRVAAPQIEVFKRDLRMRGQHDRAETITDADLLREVMNTVGQQGRLGEHIRCVVSVSMLTEGWDARTVTHVLGVRAFGTQLLCEQVIGRALRRVSYDSFAADSFDDEMRLTPEYADVLGIPFTFIPSNSLANYTPPRPLTTIRAVLPEREALTIEFPRVIGYRTVLPPERLVASFSDESRLTIDPTTAPPTARNEAIVGEGVTLSLDELKQAREATIAFYIAGHALRTAFRDADGTLKPWLFPQLLAIARRWMTECLNTPGTFPGYLLWRGPADQAVERIHRACVAGAEGPKLLRAILDPYNEIGSSRYVRFQTSKTNLYATRADKCQIDRIVMDADWEAAAAQALEEMPEVICYVRNEKLGFEVPYVDSGEEHRYRPDFIALVDDGHGADDPLHLVLEVKGRKQGADDAKHDTMRSLWLPAVNALERFGRWQFLMVDGPYEVDEKVRMKISQQDLDRMTREFWRHKTMDELMKEQGTADSSRYENIVRNAPGTAEEAKELWDAIAEDRKWQRERAKRS